MKFRSFIIDRVWSGGGKPACLAHWVSAGVFLLMLLFPALLAGAEGVETNSAGFFETLIRPSAESGSDRLKGVSEFLQESGVSASAAKPLAALIGMALVIALSVVVSLLAKLLVVRGLHRLIGRTKTGWDDELVKWRVLEKLSHLAPAILIYLAAPGVLEGYAAWSAVFVRGALIYMLIAGVIALDAALNAGMEVYGTLKIAQDVPIKSFVQVLKIVLYFIGGVVALATLMGKTPGYLLGGLGAMTAVLMLIFKDAILGLVAGIQLSGNRMLSRGDWIEMPKYGADGDVMEISLTTVKVRNWDKTVTTIPTYALISDSFKNWRGMAESGGRRIKRSINVDIQTIRFCDEEMLRRYSRIEYIKDYLAGKQRELAEYNQSRSVDLAALANGRRLTNVGTFRAYVRAYLEHHPQISQEMTFLVRQLAPGEHGLPLEIYVFSKDKVWANYESIQADIFDHILAVAREFDLRVFQSPSGADFRGFVEAAGSGGGSEDLSGIP